jgi:hypothetical protein
VINLPSDLLPYGDPVSSAETPAVLLRFPGACGVRDFLQGSLKTLANPQDTITYFTSRNFKDIRAGSALFGSFVVFDPSRLPLVRLHGSDHVFLGPNPRVELEVDVTWVPPRFMESVTDWNRYSTPTLVRELCGPDWQEERFEMSLQINAYFEEIAALAQRGIPFPVTSWYETPLDERLRLLARAGAKPRWTRA